MKQEKISVRVYGEADLIRYRSFTKSSWDLLLLTNKISSDRFIENMFDPDFFIRHNFPKFDKELKAETIDEFFADISFFGPLANQRGIVEMKFARKKVYRGTLKTFLGQDTLFPLINLKFDSIKIKNYEDTVTIGAIVRTSGQVINLFSISEVFDIDKFLVNICHITIGAYDFKLVSGFKYNELDFKKSNSDSVVRNQWAFIV